MATGLQLRVWPIGHWGPRLRYRVPLTPFGGIIMPNLKALLATVALLAQSLAGSDVHAQQQPDPELLKAKKFFESAGIPGDKWIEGETMAPHVAPAQHFNATMLYYPGTEGLQPDEVRVVFMGSTY